MTNTLLFLPDPLLHRWRRTFPNADLGRFVRTAMSDAIREQEGAEERARWAAHDRDQGTAS